MKKLLIITPHLSTGGAPQVTVNKVELLQNHFDIKVVEHAFLAWQFVVQRNRIIKLVGEQNFHSLGSDKFGELFKIIDEFKPDVISMEEFPEMFMDDSIFSNIFIENIPEFILSHIDFATSPFSSQFREVYDSDIDCYDNSYIDKEKAPENYISSSINITEIVADRSDKHDWDRI